MKSRILIVLPLILSTSAWADILPQKVIRNTSNQIDQFVASALKKKGLTANEIIDDATFARRCYINISGRIPTADEASSFIQETDPNKRGLLIDYLILSNGHKSQMFNFWADLLRVQTNKEKGGLGWHVWIRDAVDSNMPYDEFVNTMLSASGSAVDDPSVGYYLRDREMLLDNVSNTVQVFLGNRIGCAQCHDHPTEDMTQKQYYEMAAFSSANSFKNESAQLLMKKTAASELNMRVKDSTTSKDLKKLTHKLSSEEKEELKELGREYGYLLRGIGLDKIAVPEVSSKNLKIPHDYQYNDAKPGDIVKPAVFFGKELHAKNPEERKKAFADWITTPENPYFTKVIVNRLWAAAFGKGIVEPLDDWSETTRVPNPELLDYLTKIMIATEYDIREFMRVLYNTRLFESSVAKQEDSMGDSCDFKGPVLRRMKAEEFHDSLLTIQYGNQDSVANDQLKDKWSKYVSSVNKFLLSTPEDLTKLKDTSTIRRAISLDINNTKNLLKKAKQADDAKAIAQYEKHLSEASKKRNELNENDTPEMSMMMSYGKKPKTSSFIRASEKPTPHQPSSFLRQFGASDRNTIEAANTTANIPQALTLLNGKEIRNLTKPKSALMKSVLLHSSPDERLNALFLGVYGKFPTEAENTKFSALASDPDELRKLAHAMMTSKRFLFVQ